MSQSVSFNGVVYTIPDTGDDNWGDNLTDFFVAIPSGALQKSGGTFTLTADVNFGANFGLVSTYFKSRSSNIASAGVVRLANTDLIDWRNNANSANLALGASTSDRLQFGAVDIPTISSTDTLTNKTISGASNTITNVSLTSGVTGILPVGNGGTGTTALTLGSVIFAGASGTYTQDNASFFWDDTNNRLGVGTTTPSFQIDNRKSSVGATHAIRTFNSDNTDTASHSSVEIRVGGASGGDPMVHWDGPAQDWSAGIDNSDSDKWKLSRGAVLGTNDAISVTTSLAVNVHGTVTNDSAAAGDYGEFTSVNSPTGGTATPGATTVLVNVASVSLTAGDWDVEGVVNISFGGTHVGTQILVGISKSSAAQDLANSGGVVRVGGSNIASTAPYIPTGVRRISLASTSTVYLVAALTYTTLGTTTYTTDSFMQCRRMR